jgi:putative transposase
MMTPAMVHYGQATVIRQNRQLALDVAYFARPDRFVRRRPRPQPSQGGLEQQTTKLSDTH